MSYTRRLFLGKSAAAAAMAPSLARGQDDGTVFLSDDDYLEELGIEADKSTELTRTLAIDPSRSVPFVNGRAAENYWRAKSAGKTDAVRHGWAPVEDHADYHHLRAAPAPQSAPFELTAAHLALLAERNHFALKPDLGGLGAHILVGFRGCVIAPSSGGDPDDTGWVDAARLQAATPDHVNFRCVIGVWDRRRAKVRFFSASTVPGVDHIWRQYQYISGANMQPTGLYAYAIGAHRASARTRQVQAFIARGGRYYRADGSPAFKDDHIVVLRTIDDLVYSPRNDGVPEAEHERYNYSLAWASASAVYDNIHAGVYYPGAIGTDKPVKFSSAGCNVVKGGYEAYRQRNAAGKLKAYHRTKSLGPWAAFKEAAGLQNPPQSDGVGGFLGDGAEFHYMLLTGHEAALVASGALPDEYRPIRIGSSGPAVAQAQAKLFAALKQTDPGYQIPFAGQQKADGSFKGFFDSKSVHALERRQFNMKKFIYGVLPLGSEEADEILS